jgi:hypothetical protein
LGCFLQEPDVRCIAICDVRAERRTAVKKMVDEKYGNRDCATYRDFRELLARNDVDAVLIATGPNWHATAAIQAASAGKDIFLDLSRKGPHRRLPVPICRSVAAIQADSKAFSREFTGKRNTGAHSSRFRSASSVSRKGFVFIAASG